MKTATKFTMTLLTWLWFALLIFGLNAALNFIEPGLLLYALVFFLLVDLVLPRAGVIFKIIIALVMVHRTYYIGSFFSPRWLVWLAADLHTDLAKIAEASSVLPVTAMTGALLAAIAAQKLYHALISRGKAALFLLFLGTVLLTGASMWAGRGSAWWVVLYVFLGLTVMATTRVQLNLSFPMGRWLSTLLIWVLVLTSAAWALPDGDIDLAQWWDSALSWKTGQGARVKGKVGYGVYDGSLGAPLEADDTPALKVTSPVPVYLRGETRHSYTGRGWDSVYRIIGDELTGPSHLEGMEVAITVEVLSSQGVMVFAPRYPLDIKMNQGDKQLVIHSLSGGAPDNLFAYENYSFASTEALEAGMSYTIEAMLPVDDPETLRMLSNTGADGQYLQLNTDLLPQRVIDLAHSVTAEADNGYDKAMALVRFLRQGTWKYSLETSAPPQDRDFVDWFLFEMDRGYCVHFSTAFVIMARAAGLPARWVKGYSFGVRDEWDNFIVQNRHAHSWAEVWFDGYGWVPFEPTPGAVLPTVEETEETPGGNQNPDPDLPDPPLIDPGIELPHEPGGGPNADAAGLSKSAIALIAAGLLAAGLLLITLTRNASLAAVYTRLQKRLRLFGWHRQTWETPREHVDRVKELPERAALSGFVRRFEESVYGRAKKKKVPERRRLLLKYSLIGLALRRFSSRR